MAVALLCAMAPMDSAEAVYAQYNEDGTIACTMYAWTKAREWWGVSFPNNWGDAGDWYQNSGDQFPKDKRQAPYSIACWSKENSPSHGHVALVMEAGPDYIMISEGGSHWAGATDQGICNRTIYTWSTYNGTSLWPDQGFIHLKDAVPAKPSFDFQDYPKYDEVGCNFAHFGVKIYGSVESATDVGCILYDADKKELGSCQDGAYLEGDCLIHHFLFKAGSSDIDIRLTPNTSYSYQFYVVAGGEKYYSDYNDFKTNSVSTDFTFEDYPKYYELGSDYAHFGVKIYGDSIASVSNVGFVLYDADKNILKTCEDPAYLEGNCLIHHYLIQSGSADIDLALTPGTNYYYTYYVLLDGKKYPSEYLSFKTKGVSFRVRYDANGGTNPPTDQFANGEGSTASVVLSSSVPNWTGHTFLGWSKSKDATAASWQPGDTYTGSSDVTLYAVWNLDTYTVNYDPGTEDPVTNMPMPQSKPYGVDLVLRTEIPVREGYTFSGWATLPVSPVVVYFPGNTYTLNASLTLYAVWGIPAQTPTQTPTSTPATPTPTGEPVATPTPVSTPTGTPVSTPTDAPTPTFTPAPTSDPTNTPAPTATPEPAIGDVFALSGLKYAITGRNTVSFIGLEKPNSKAALAVPATVAYGGTTYKVTAVGAKAVYKDAKVKTVTLGKYVKAIEKNAFASCQKLVTVKGGAAITKIGAAAFGGCKVLKTFPVLSKLQEIGAEAFRNCVKLTAFTLAKTVKSIGKNAFNGCSALKTITVQTTKLTEKNVGASAFKGIYKKATFRCPKSKLKAYKKLFIKRGALKTCKFVVGK